MSKLPERREGWRSRIRDKLHIRGWRERSSKSPGPSIVDDQDTAKKVATVENDQSAVPIAQHAADENVIAVENNEDLPEIEIKRDIPLPLTGPSVIIESDPGVRLELTLANNTQQVISLGPDTPAGQWTDIWSIAYREAMASFSRDVQEIFMKGKNFEELLQKLEDANEASKNESIFRRGLDNLQKPLETCKLVLDFATPFLSMEPTAATAAGVVQGVTTVAIGICGAASELSDQISKMLERIPYIDDCDALTRNGDGSRNVHRALVCVYIDLLNFYLAAFKIVNSKYFVLKAVVSHLQAELPTIVGQFITHADLLNNQIQNAILQAVQHVTKSILNDKVNELLGAAKHAGRSNLHASIRKARSDSACSWILQDVRFKNWYSTPTSKHLFLHGSMGCGKTVTAAYVIDEVGRLNKHQVPKPLTCYHYCKADTAGDSIYIFSSLILQLIQFKGDSLKKEFCEWHDRRTDDLNLDPTQSADELRAFLRKSVDALERPLYIILDGLDECESDTLTDIIDFIEEISEKTPPVKFCLTSRYTHGQMSILQQSSYSIEMIEDAQRDETIARHMVKKKLRKLDEDLQSEIIRQLTARAKGSAIWIKMTIDLFEKKSSENKKLFIKVLRGEGYYSQLPGLYAKIFSHITKESVVDEHLLTEALEILAVTKRPLLVQELQWAVAMQMSPPGRKQVLERLEMSAGLSPILEFLQPFIHDINDEELETSYVRLAHDSIRQLVLEYSPSSWKDLGTTDKLGSLEYVPRKSELEAKLSALCVEYLMLDEINQKDLFDWELPAAEFFEPLAFDDTDSDDTEPEDTKPIYYDPLDKGFGGFFAYSSCFWVEHAKHAAVEAAPSLSTIITLTSAKSKRFRNWFQQFCRPDCTIRAKLDDNVDQMDPLVFISLYGTDTMLQELLRAAETDTDHFISDSAETAIKRITLHGDISRLKCLIEHFQQDSLRSLALTELMRRWVHRHDFIQMDNRKWDECFDLVLPSSEQLIEQKSGNEWLCTAVRLGCFPVVEKLFEAADSNPALRDELLCGRLRGDPSDMRPNPWGHQSVGLAAHNSDTDMLRYLLGQEGIEAHLNYVNPGGYGVLHLAAVQGYLEVFKLLVPRLKAQVNKTNGEGSTALQVLVFKYNPEAVECAKVLLTKGKADVSAGVMDDGTSGKYFHPIRQAVRAGSIDMCHLLVKHGHADPCVALDVYEGEASLRDYVNAATSIDAKERARDILEVLSSFAGIKPSREVGPRKENPTQ